MTLHEGCWKVCASFTLFLIYKTHSFSTFLSLLSLSRNNHGFHIFRSTSTSGTCFLVITSGIRANRGRIVVFLGEKSRFWLKIIGSGTVHREIIEFGKKNFSSLKILPSLRKKFRVWNFFTEFGIFFRLWEKNFSSLKLLLPSLGNCYRVWKLLPSLKTLTEFENFHRVWKVCELGS